jgi:hypothetical protein
VPEIEANILLPLGSDTGTGLMDLKLINDWKWNEM